MNAEKSTDNKTVTLPSFSGEKKDYKVWLKRFTAYATLKGFSVALRDTHVLPVDPEALTTAGSDKEKRRKSYRAKQSCHSVYDHVFHKT